MSPPSGMHPRQDEKVLWKGKMGWRSLWALLLIGILSIWIYGLGIIFIVYAAAKRVKTDYIITNRRVIKAVEHYAFLSTDIFELKNEEVKDAYVTRTVIGEKIDFGDIIITSDTKKVVFNGIPHPSEEMKIIRSIM